MRGDSRRAGEGAHDASHREFLSHRNRLLSLVRRHQLTLRSQPAVPRELAITPRKRIRQGTGSNPSLLQPSGVSKTTDTSEKTSVLVTLNLDQRTSPQGTTFTGGPAPVKVIRPFFCPNHSFRIDSCDDARRSVPPPKYRNHFNHRTL